MNDDGWRTLLWFEQCGLFFKTCELVPKTRDTDEQCERLAIELHRWFVEQGIQDDDIYIFGSADDDALSVLMTTMKVLIMVDHHYSKAPGVTRMITVWFKVDEYSDGKGLAMLYKLTFFGGNTP